MIETRMQAKNESLKTAIRYFKGVGPKKAEELSRLGIQMVEDILYYLPFRYEDRSNFTPIKDLKIGERQAIRGRVTGFNSRLTRRGMGVFQMTVSDDTGSVQAVWFNQPYLKDYFKSGQEVVLYGRVELRERPVMVQPEYEMQDKESGLVSVNMERIVPIYPATSNLTQKYIRGLVFEAVTKYCRLLEERLPTYILAREKLVDLKFAIHNIHFPVNFNNLARAYRRIVFEEFLLLQLALALKRREAKNRVFGPGKFATGKLTDGFRERLGFELTAGQKKAIADIERDMSSERPMNRLLEGDVGSGKTIVAAYALTLAVQGSFQAAIMAPTEVLARQHFITLSELLMPLGINVVLLVGGIERVRKNEIYSEIKEGRTDVVVGTHAIIQEPVEFKRLGLVVVDEQHKFGVAQRAMLKEKSYSPHVLLMTATPIPRTLALTVYGDLDISIISQLPEGRIPIVTYWVEEARRKKVYKFIKEELDNGRQAYIICPLIEEGQGSRAKGQGAVGMFERLKKEEFADYEVGLLHGRMSSAEKEKVMRQFKKGKLDLLVSTVVIEVGIDSPNATVMLIENAERFGLSQLHQLRGRVGRGGHESYCILLGEPKSEEAAKRLKTIEETLDGFAIAEADLDLRGPGEFFGTRQHGLPEIKFGNILKDFDIMESARRQAFSIVGADPCLAEERHRHLKSSLASRFKGYIDLIHVA